MSAACPLSALTSSRRVQYGWTLALNQKTGWVMPLTARVASSDRPSWNTGSFSLRRKVP